MPESEYQRMVRLARIRRLWAWLSERQAMGQQAPSYREIHGALNYSSLWNINDTVRRDLVALKESGYITRAERRARAIRVVVPLLTAGTIGVAIVHGPDASWWRAAVAGLPPHIRAAYPSGRPAREVA